MATVVSKDGTQIAYDRVGQGPAVILVDGALSYRSAGLMGPVAALLARHFSAYTFDRRGRGESGDTAPYAVEREIEDIQALLTQAGGSASLYGLSSGAVLVLRAAAALKGIHKLALYEPPFVVDNSRLPVPGDLDDQYARLLASGRRGDMVELFMTKAVGVPAEYIAPMRQQPNWPVMEGIAHTLAYDNAIMGRGLNGGPLPPELVREAAAVTAPALVMAGGASPDWMHNAARAAAQAIPGAQYRVLEGQTHGVAAEAIAPVLIEFFRD